MNNNSKDKKENNAMTKEEKKLEKVIEVVKNMTEDARERKAVTKARRKALKRKVFDMEAENYDRLIIYGQNEMWLAMGGNSALMYVYDVSLRMNKRRPLSLKADTDWECNFPQGIAPVSRQYLPTLLEALQKMKIKLESADEKEDLWILKMDRTYNKDALLQLSRTQQAREQKLKSQIFSKLTFAETVHKAEILLDYTCKVTTRKQTSGQGEVLKLLMKSIIDVNMLLVKQSKGQIEKEKFIEDMNSGTIEIEGLIGLAFRANLVDIDRAEGIMTRLQEVRKMFAVELGAEKKNKEK